MHGQLEGKNQEPILPEEQAATLLLAEEGRIGIIPPRVFRVKKSCLTIDKELVNHQHWI
jgi:hypothetical protein